LFGAWNTDLIDAWFQIACWSILYRLQEDQTRIVMCGGTASVPNEDTAMELILIIVLLVLLFGGGGYFGRNRGYW